MGLIGYERQTHLNKKINILGYPPLLFVILLVVLLFLNGILIVVLKSFPSILFAILLDLAVIIFSYKNYLRVKKNQSPLYYSFNLTLNNIYTDTNNFFKYLKTDD